MATVTPETPPTTIAGITNVGNVKCCEDCTTCLCPDGYRYPSDFLNVTCTGFTGVFTPFNTTYTAIRDAPVTPNLYYQDLVVSPFYRQLYMLCRVPDAAGLRFGLVETDIRTNDVNITFSGGDSCHPFFITRTITHTCQWFDGTALIDISQTFTVTVYR